MASERGRASSDDAAVVHALTESDTGKRALRSLLLPSETVDDEDDEDFFVEVS